MAAIFAAVMLLWLLSGRLIDSEPVPAAGGDQAAPALTLVSARAISAQAFPTAVAVRARTEANRRVDVRAEIGGQVVSVPAQEGTAVKAGDVICELAVEDRKLRLEEAHAAVASAQLEYDGALRLKSGGYQSKTAIAGSKARLESAKANLKRRQLDLAQLKIRAPFDGIVNDRAVEVGDLIQRGDICATVLDLNPLVISGQVSETEVGRIRLGGVAQAQLATGQEVQGQVRFISRSSDEVTRTFRVEVTVPNPNFTLHGGITSRLTIPTGEIAAHLVTGSVLSLDDAGNVGVRILDEDDRVQYVPVTLVGDDREGVWVTGLPEVTRLITIGQEYVIPGEKVAVSLDETPAALPVKQVVESPAEQEPAPAEQEPATKSVEPQSARSTDQQDLSAAQL